MIKFIIKRFLYVIPVMLGVLILVFLMKVAMQGGPETELLPITATEAEKDALREELGLNDPIPVQFVKYVWGIVSRGDFGVSYKTKQPVFDELMQRFPRTISIGLMALLLSQIFANPLGLLSAAKQYSWVDNLIIVFTIIGASLPAFWLALMMIIVFSVHLGWLPSTFDGSAAGYVMPVIASSFTSMAAAVRGVRTSMLEMIRQDYVRTARAKGQKEVVVIVNHAFRNALVPVVSGIGFALGTMLGGSLIIETVFSVPGVGKYIADAVSQRNFPAIQGGIIILSFAYTLINIAVDVCYTIVDPRLKTTFLSPKKPKKILSPKKLKKINSAEVVRNG